MDSNIMLFLGFVGSLLAILIPILGGIIRLNTSITKLNVTMENIDKKTDESNEDREKIHSQLNNHETRIAILEKN